MNEWSHYKLFCKLRVHVLRRILLALFFIGYVGRDEKVLFLYVFSLNAKKARKTSVGKLFCWTRVPGLKEERFEGLGTGCVIWGQLKDKWKGYLKKLSNHINEPGRTGFFCTIVTKPSLHWCWRVPRDLDTVSSSMSLWATSTSDICKLCVDRILTWLLSMILFSSRCIFIPITEGRGYTHFVFFRKEASETL